MNNDLKSVELRHVDVVQYRIPLREGGSLPAIVLGSDDFQYVLKFRGAGQGTKALIAEIIGGELARAIGLNVPERVFMNLDASFGQTEGDEEIQDLLKFSVGLNLGLHYLSGSITYDPLVSVADSLSASKIILLDSIITNIDRTAKNTNLLNWNKELWIIDHGASLYFHHNWNNWKGYVYKPFPLIKDHVLLDRANSLEEAVQVIREALTPDFVAHVISILPVDWLVDPATTLSEAEKRAAYRAFINTRISNIDLITKEIINVKK